eukprot:Gb_35187 [translate_table: standard]
MQTGEHPKGYWQMGSAFGNVNKTKSCQLLLVILSVSYVLGFTFSMFSHITGLADGGGAEAFYPGIIIDTRIVLQNHPLETQKESSEDPQPDRLSCSSLINGMAKPNETWRNGDDVLCCDRSHFRTDVCYLRGDVRTHSPSFSILLHSNNTQNSTEEKIRPYTRKWETSIMNTVDEITLKTVNPAARNACQVNHSVPAVVFSTGGYTGNVYHEFNDGLLPLYITSEHLNREVVLVILEYHDWWMLKYGEIVQQLTNYPVVAYSRDKRVHCFPEMMVGLKIHDELTVNPSLMKNGKNIRDFQRVLSQGLAPRLRAIAGPPKGNETSSSITHGLKGTPLPKGSGTRFRPRLLIISRRKSRVMVNQKQIVRLAEKIGFQVEILNPKRTTELAEMYRALNSCDVMIGVHGAAMTHFLFMRPGSVFIQIVPLGTDWAAATYYGEPAVKLGLKYIEYKILPEESSLFEKYERNDPVLTHPDSITSKGWWETKKVYLDGQNVRPSLRRLKKRLANAYAYTLSTEHTNEKSM